MQRFTRTTLLTASSLAIIAALYFGISHIRNSGPPSPGAAPPVKFPHDSPIEVAGGSINICSQRPMNPDSSDPNRWQAAVTDVNPIAFTGLTFLDGTTSPINTKGNWAIHVQDGNKDAFELDSQSGGPVTIEARDKAGHRSKDGYAVLFHDPSCTSSQCDHIQTVIINIDHGASHIGSCASGSCDVYVGTISSATKECIEEDRSQ